MAFADVKYGCLQMLDGLVSTHPLSDNVSKFLVDVSSKEPNDKLSKVDLVNSIGNLTNILLGLAFTTWVP
jgi:hypothetical protein